MEKYILYFQQKQDQELTVAQIMNFSSVTVVSGVIFYSSSVVYWTPTDLGS